MEDIELLIPEDSPSTGSGRMERRLRDSKTVCPEIVEASPEFDEAALSHAVEPFDGLVLHVTEGLGANDRAG